MAVKILVFVFLSIFVLFCLSQKPLSAISSLQLCLPFPAKILVAQDDSESKAIDIPGEKDANGGTHYSIPDLPIEITFPDGWVMQQPASDQPLYFVHPGDSDWRDMTLDIRDIAGPDDLKEAIKSDWEDIHKKYKNVVDLRPPSSASRVIVYAYKYTDDDGTIVHAIDFVVSLPRLKKALWLEASTPEPAFKKNREEIMGIAKSIRQKQKPANSN